MSTTVNQETHRPKTMREAFRHFSHWTAGIVGSPWAFGIAILTIIAWAASGHLFHYSDTWQLVINTGTTIVTFLIVFLIQNTQNRDSRAIHLKLDELIRAVKGARNNLINLQELSDAELDDLDKQFHSLLTERKIKPRVREAPGEEH